MAEVTMQNMLQKWVSHKIVMAGKIIKIIPDTEGDDCVQVNVETTPGKWTAFYFDVQDWQKFVARGRPKEGESYFVIYEDGYQSWSPADVFEKGYAKLEGK